MDIEKIAEVSMNLLTQWGLKVVGAIALLIVGRAVAEL